jgi:hypothetical protein
VVNLELVFAEIGLDAHPVDKVHFLKYFPDARISVITQGKSIGDKNHLRWGWRMNDYWKVCGLLQSNADIAIAFDADMQIVSDDVKHVIGLARSFGLCMPANPRKLVKVDNEVGADAQLPIVEETGLMYAVNCGIIALDRSSEDAMKCVRSFLYIMETHPMRGPMAWNKAFRATGFFPCLLPPQWCVCAEDVGIGNEIILHIGHNKVREHYAKVI